MNKVFRDSEGNVRNGWKVLGFLVLLFSIGRAITLAIPPSSPFFKAHSALIPPTVGATLIALIPTFLCLKAERNSLASVGLVMDRTWLREALLGTGLGIGLILLVALVIRQLGGFHLEFVPGLSLTALLAGVWLYIWVAVFEELLFRGYLFQRLTRGLGAWFTQALLAVFFAAGHWGNPGMHGATKVWATLNIAVAAIMLGLAYYKTRSLALPIGLHLGWNWAQGCLMGFGVSGTSGTATLFKPIFHGRPEWLTGGAFGLEASLPSLIILTAFSFWLAASKQTKPASALESKQVPQVAPAR